MGKRFYLSANGSFYVGDEELSFLCKLQALGKSFWFVEYDVRLGGFVKSIHEKAVKMLKWEDDYLGAAGQFFIELLDWPISLRYGYGTRKGDSFRDVDVAKR